MKTRYILAALTLIIISSLSCKKSFLELSPQNTRLEENFYKTEKDMFEALVATYDVLQWGGYKGYIPETMLCDAASDDTHAGGANAADQPSWVALDNFTLTPSLGPQLNIWGRYYAGIYRANIFLEKIDGAETSETFYKRTVAEVKFLRAYYYFMLERWFGNIPLILKTLSPAEYNYPQSKPTEIFAQIEKDLNEAIPDLPEMVSGAEAGRISKGAGQALLARVILFQNNNSRMTEVVTLTESVINSGIYSLVPDFASLWDVENRNSPESVFEIQHSEKSSWGDWGWLPGGEGNIGVQMIGMRDYNGPMYNSGWGFCPVTPELVAAMQGDPRFDATIIDASQGELSGGFFNTVIDGQNASYKPGYQNTGYFNKKFAPLKAYISPDGTPELNWTNNIIEIRYADVLLMAAEAHARSGNSSMALNYLNQIRNRVGLTNAPGIDLLQEIYNERRIELALEGQRYWDLIRTGKASQSLSEKGWRANRNEFLPIPQGEIDNTQGVLIQNPGY